MGIDDLRLMIGKTANRQLGKSTDCADSKNERRVERNTAENIIALKRVSA